MTKTWWKEAVIYQVYPRSFKDSNGDGIGDLKGIIEKLDYLSELGVDVLWLSPIFKSPNKDNGYDVSDYEDIMDEFGTMDEFDELLALAHQKGLKIILDLVVNHSSDQHHWFQESRKSKDNPYSDYYIWKKDKPNNWPAFFGGEAWSFDEQRQEYYLHLFTKEQPDLNWENPKVREEIFNMINFWYQKGIDGFRMDVIPLISKRQDFPEGAYDNFDELIFHTYANGPRLHEYLHEMYVNTAAKFDVMTVGECIGVNAQNCMLYVDERREELNMLYHFEHMQLDSQKGSKYDKKPWKLTEFKSIFRSWDTALGTHGWYNVFLDNHDFPRMVSRFGNEDQYRTESAKLLATLLLTLRGTPCLYQGSEIGMTNVHYKHLDQFDDVWAKNYIQEQLDQGADETILLEKVNVGGRDNARTPMQWDHTDFAGFSSAKPWLTINSNFKEINVADSLENKDSILHFYKNLLALRKLHKTFIYGTYEELHQEDEQLFIYERSDESAQFLVLLNMSGANVPLQIKHEIQTKKLIIGNYNSINDHQSMKPWEARIYKLK